MSFMWIKDMKTRIDHEDPILQDQELINLAKHALGSKRAYENTQADMTEIRDWLNREVPLIHGFGVKTPKELRESGKEKELYVALQVINGDKKPSVLFDLQDKYKSENLLILRDQ